MSARYLNIEARERQMALYLASLEDFTGWYQPVLFPWFRWEMYMEGDVFYSAEQESHSPSEWEEGREPRTVVPLDDELGFEIENNGDVRLVYNDRLRRFEIVRRNRRDRTHVIRMPLAWSKSAPPPGGETPPEVGIGIPSWH